MPARKSNIEDCRGYDSGPLAVARTGAEAMTEAEARAGDGDGAGVGAGAGAEGGLILALAGAGVTTAASVLGSKLEKYAG